MYFFRKTGGRFYMAIKTNRVNPADQLKRNRNVRVFQVRCSACSCQEFLTLYEGGEGIPESKLGRAVTELPEKCPRCGAVVTATEFPLFTK